MNKTKFGLYLSVGLFLIGCMTGEAGDRLMGKYEMEEVQKLIDQYKIPVSDYPERFVPEKDWPRHVAPILLFQGWKSPSAVWRIHGGHLIAFEAGEWGSAIFFLPLDSQDLLLLAEKDVKSIVKLSKGNYVAAGGNRMGGTVMRLWVGPELKWHSKILLRTSAGMPTLLGLRDGAPLIAIIEHTTDLGGSQRKNAPVIVTEKKSLFGLYTVNADGEIEVLDLPTKR